MTGDEIKGLAKKIVNDGFVSKFNNEWCEKYFTPFGDGLNEAEVILLDDLVCLYIAYKRSEYSFKDAKALTDGFISGFQEECEEAL